MKQHAELKHSHTQQSAFATEKHSEANTEIFKVFRLQKIELEDKHKDGYQTKLTLLNYCSALLANVSALSAIQYLRQYMKMKNPPRDDL